jgi:hypothetical protein
MSKSDSAPMRRVLLGRGFSESLGNPRESTGIGREQLNCGALGDCDAILASVNR